MHPGGRGRHVPIHREHVLVTITKMDESHFAGVGLQNNRQHKLFLPSPPQFSPPPDRSSSDPPGPARLNAAPFSSAGSRLPPHPRPSPPLPSLRGRRLPPHWRDRSRRPPPTSPEGSDTTTLLHRPITGHRWCITCFALLCRFEEVVGGNSRTAAPTVV